MTPSTATALLVLADGTVLEGEAFGARGTAIGEVVFNTGMTGYQEVMTDPSYAGQLVTFTYPELGNTCARLASAGSTVTAQPWAWRRSRIARLMPKSIATTR